MFQQLIGKCLLHRVPTDRLLFCPGHFAHHHSQNYYCCHWSHCLLNCPHCCSLTHCHDDACDVFCFSCFYVYYRSLHHWSYCHGVCVLSSLPFYCLMTPSSYSSACLYLPYHLWISSWLLSYDFVSSCVYLCHYLIGQIHLIVTCVVVCFLGFSFR